jgi:hypothetical protein
MRLDAATAAVVPSNVRRFSDDDVEVMNSFPLHYRLNGS